MTENKKGILLIGPFPPPFAGQSTLLKNILESRLADTFTLDFLNVTHQKPGSVKRLCLTVLFTIRLFVKLIRPNNIKLLHIHTSAGIPLYEKSLFSLAGKLFGKKVLLHVHGGKFRKFWEASGAVGRFTTRKALDLNNGVIVLSSDQKRYFEERVHCEAEIMALPNAVRVETVDVGKADSEVTTFLYVGHLKQEKGLLDLLAAIRLLQAENGPPIMVRLMGVGDTLENEEQIHRAFAVADIQCVEFLGLLTGAEKWRQFTAAKVFVLPSHSEDMPLSILEAMAFGLPVIATNVGAIPEVIESDVNGYLITPHDIKALAEKMKLMAEKPRLRKTIGLINQQKAERDFSFDAYERKLAEIYLDVIEGRTG